MKRQPSKLRRLLFAVIAIAMFFGSIEGLLWLFDIGASSRVEAMAFTFPVEEYNDHSPRPFLERDPELFWKPKPGVLGHNSHGCLGPEFSEKPAKDVFRIVCLGDSCTHFGPVPYPTMLQEKLDQLAPGRFEVINAAVIGYSSFQGLRLLETKVLDWSPHLVTVYFGWNDHWLARHFTDKDQPLELPLATRAANVLDYSRTFQLMRLAAHRARSPERPGLRVSLSDYKANLLKIQSMCEQRRTQVWFLTAPQALDQGIPEYLYTSGEVDDPANLVELHQSFNNVVRDVTSSSGTVLVDLAKDFDQTNKSETFEFDHIHLSDQGKEIVTDQLLQQLQVAGILIPAPDQTSQQ